MFPKTMSFARKRVAEPQLIYRLKSAELGGGLKILPYSKVLFNISDSKLLFDLISRHVDWELPHDLPELGLKRKH